MADIKDIPQEPIVAENPEPMEQDVTESPSTVPPVPSEQSSSSQSLIAGTGKSFFQKLFGEKAAEKPVMTFAERLVDLENRELFSNGLNADEYIEFILMDIITGKRNFVDTLYRAQQRVNDNTIKSLAILVGFITNWNIKAASKHLRSIKFKQEKNQKLASEVDNRLKALLLMIVARCYSTIKTDHLHKTLECFGKEELQNIMSTFDWKITANDVVKVSVNSKVKDYVFTKLINPEMGQFELVEKILPETKENIREIVPLDKIRQVISISDQLMKVTLPPKNSEDEKKSATVTVGSSSQVNGGLPKI